MRTIRPTRHDVRPRTVVRPGRRARRLAAFAAAGVLTTITLGVGPSSGPAGADGTETLGTPSIPIAGGTGFAIASVGLFVQPGSLQVTIPQDATVTQAILYFEAGHRAGDTSGTQPDDTIRVNGRELTGTLIGGPTPFYGTVIANTQRIDITSLGLVGPGTTTLTIDGLDTDEVGDGAGLLVLYRQPAPAAQLGVVDGNDIAFVNFAPPLDTTVPQTFRFDAAPAERTARLGLMVSSIHDPVTGTESHRPHAVALTAGGRTTELADAFADAGGREFDSTTLDVTIPAGADTLTVQLLSRPDATGDLPASLVWVSGVLAVTPPAAVPTTVTSVPQETTTTPTSVLPTVPTNGLPFTGDPTAAVVAAGTVAIAIGTALVVTGKRRAALRR